MSIMRGLQPVILLKMNFFMDIFQGFFLYF